MSRLQQQVAETGFGTSPRQPGAGPHQGVATMADVHELERAGLPRDLPSSTYEMLQRGAAINPSAPALSFFLTVDDHHTPEVWTYQAFLERVTQAANLFHSLGIGEKDVVAFLLPNLPETHFTIWGGEAAGIAFAINPLLDAEAIADLLNAAGAKVLVTLAPFPRADLFARLRPVLGRVPSLQHLVLVNLADHVRGWRGIPARLLQWREARRVGPVPKGLRVHDFNRALARMPGDRLVSGRVIAPGDLSSFFCTGGTTGTPKIAMRSHANEVANAWMAGRFLSDGQDDKTTFFCGLPLFHVNAVMVTGLLPFSQGAHVVLGTPQGYRGEGVVKRFWEIVERHRINFFSGVPTLYSSLLQVPVGGRDIRSLRYGLCGAAPMPTEVFRTFQDRTGLAILEGYGLTEGACVSTVNPPHGDRRIGSIGLRLPGQEMKAVILDEAGAYVRDCGVDEVGVIAITGPNVFAGYKAESHNKGVWIDMGDGRRWLNTGDLGRQDADGYFWLTGRRKDLIIRGGHNIDPAMIEEALHGHPAVELAAAVGRPDAHAGELPVAYVQLKAGAVATEEELLAFAQAHILERAAIPKAVRILKALPLTAVGKIFKPRLRLMEAEEAAKATLADAGLEVEAVKAVDDKTRGLVVTVTVAPELAARVRTTLGCFAFGTEVNSPG
jgi:fatty-acyl-CoA synthase